MKMRKHGVKPSTSTILLVTAYIGTIHKSLKHV
jgi:hypothetical protein